MRIVVLGCPGSGKSTFARTLRARTGLPLIHLDVEYWSPGWVRADAQEWEVKHTELIARETWIIDGDYAASRKQRLGRADIAIFFDYPTIICLARILKRIFFSATNREDVPIGCDERLSFEFLRLVLFYRLSRRKVALSELSAAAEAKTKIFVIRTDKRAEEVCAEITRMSLTAR